MSLLHASAGELGESSVVRRVRDGGRRSAKGLAEIVLPPSLVTWRGREGRTGLAPLARLVGAPPATRAGRVALTFDDGPTPLTLDYLAVLEQLGVRATFFVVGELCRAEPQLVREMAARGHELAGHGYTHRPFPELSERELRSELGRTWAALPPCARARPLVRPPFGAVSPRTLLICAKDGFTTVLWSLNSGDWRNLNSRDVEKPFTTDTATAGDIVLLHEGQTWTLNALPAIVGSLRKAGHELVTVGELLD